LLAYSQGFIPNCPKGLPAIDPAAALQSKPATELHMLPVLVIFPPSGLGTFLACRTHLLAVPGLGLACACFASKLAECDCVWVFHALFTLSLPDSDPNML